MSLNYQSAILAKGYEWETFRIPEPCQGVEVVVGIDEAGRGPVLGSLIYTVAFWPVSEDEIIGKMGFNDSKQLKEQDRERLLDNIRNHPSIGWVIEEITAESIAEQMLCPSPISLNALSYDAVVRALKKVVNATKNPPKITTVYVDTVGDPEYYKSKLITALGDDFADFVIEKKADAKYKTVSAASIIAKVTRDKGLQNWRWVEPGLHLDKTFGSGYPGDEVCVQWLKRSIDPVFGFPNIVRFSWSTCTESLKSSNAVGVLWECDDEDTGCQDIASFFGSKTIKRPRTNYFGKRKLTRLNADALIKDAL